MLEEAGQPLPRTVFVKLMFLFRMETELGRSTAFYDFVPYKFGPFSFALYRDLQRLEAHGYVSNEGNHFTLKDSALELTQQQTRRLTRKMRFATNFIFGRYGRMSHNSLIRNVYRRYPWYAQNSELPERKLVATPLPQKALPAVYTVGYEGKSVDAFFNDLMNEGIEKIIDVRANPVSRKYGFSALRMRQISKRLRLEYCHVPSLGIPSKERASLKDFATHQLLFQKYDKQTLLQQSNLVKELAVSMCRKPSVLVCFEKDSNYCHRSKLATALAHETGLKVIHL